MSRVRSVTGLLLVMALASLVSCVQGIERTGTSTPTSTLAPENHLAEGQNLVAQERWEEAIAEFTEVLNSNPQRSLAYYYRGRFYFNLEHYQQAKADLTKALELDPQLSQAYYYLGRSHLERRAPL